MGPLPVPAADGGTTTPASGGGLAFHLWASALALLGVALFLLGGPGQKSRRPACRWYAPVIPPA